MLAADKLQLQSALKQQATALKEKEFNLHHSNLSKCQIYKYKLHLLRTVTEHPTPFPREGRATDSNDVDHTVAYHLFSVSQWSQHIKSDCWNSGSSIGGLECHDVY
jgi:hypothetical protein